MWLATRLFTNTPDEHFVVDILSEQPQVAVGAGFSGHGFEFASVVGRILAGLVVDGETEHPIGIFRLTASATVERYLDSPRPNHWRPFLYRLVLHGTV